jgi:hypothetical protein
MGRHYSTILKTFWELCKKMCFAAFAMAFPFSPFDRPFLSTQKNEGWFVTVTGSHIDPVFGAGLR